MMEDFNPYRSRRTREFRLAQDRDKSAVVQRVEDAKAELQKAKEQVQDAKDTVRRAEQALKNLEDEQKIDHMAFQAELTEEWRATLPASTPEAKAAGTLRYQQAIKGGARLAKIVDRLRLSATTVDEAIAEIEQRIAQLFVDVQTISDPSEAEGMFAERETLRNAIRQLAGEPKPDPMPWRPMHDDDAMDRILDATPRKDTNNSEE